MFPFNGLSVNVPASGSVTLQVNSSFANSAPAGTYQFSLTGAVGTNGQAVNFSGLPYNSATITIANATLTPSPTPTSSATFTPTPSATKIVIYPNPADGTKPVNIHIPGLNSIADVKVEIFTTAFRKVQEKPYSQQPVGVDVSIILADKWGTPLASGLYYVVVVTIPQPGSGQSSNRLIGKLLILR